MHYTKHLRRWWAHIRHAALFFAPRLLWLGRRAALYTGLGLVWTIAGPCWALERLYGSVARAAPGVLRWTARQGLAGLALGTFGLALGCSLMLRALEPVHDRACALRMALR